MSDQERCAWCGAEFGVRVWQGHEYPDCKSWPVSQGQGKPPVSVRLCPGCWAERAGGPALTLGQAGPKLRQAAEPERFADLPLFAMGEVP